MATKKEALEQSQKALEEFFNLSKFLLGEEAPYDVNEIPEDHPFYEPARAIAEDMELDWEKMSHEDSNRVMLNLLSDYFLSIKPDGDYQTVLTVSFTRTVSLAKE